MFLMVMLSSHCPLIGPDRSRDLNTGSWLVSGQGVSGVSSHLLMCLRLRCDWVNVGAGGWGCRGLASSHRVGASSWRSPRLIIISFLFFFLAPTGVQKMLMFDPPFVRSFSSSLSRAVNLDLSRPEHLESNQRVKSSRYFALFSFGLFPFNFWN